MRKTSLCIAVSCCACFVAGFAYAQVHRKAGLWEITSKMTWQKSPFPENMPGMPNMAAAMGGPHTAQVCITQDMIDKYGAPMPPSRNNECKAENMKMSDHGMTADWVCNGSMKGKGTVESSWTDENHSTSKVHFAGTMQMGPQPKDVEWTSDSTSVYKGADCGNVKPVPMPK
jgi:Protein of unknown function (DUF3617)